MRTKLLFALCGLLAVSPALLRAADQVIITEFMAANTSTIADEDGAFSDWVEIYNAGTNTVNLNGWFLTDNAANLTKWQFPSTNLAPNAFMVVWASGKNRRVPGAPLHTSFSLSAIGEYLALVRPGGVIKASEFAPTFPNQFNDVAYGFSMAGTTTTLLAAGADGRALVPAADIGTGWRSVGYDDSTWISGTTGMGYDLGTNYLPAIGLNLGASMSNVNASAYLRAPFTIADPAAYKSLTLRMRYDDGFVAYLNGAEVVRRNAPALPLWNSVASAVHGPPLPGSLLENFEGGAGNYTLNQYGVAPAPSVQPAGAGSTGSYLRLMTDTVNGAFNSVAFRQTAPGLFSTIVSDFDYRLSNTAANPADGFALLFLPTATYGTNGPGVTTQAFGIEEPNYAGVFAIGFDVYPHTTQNDVSVHWNGAEKLNVTMSRATFEMVAGVFHHVKVTLQHVTGGARVTVTFTANINGVPAAPYTPINNFFVAGLDPYQSRVQFAGRTGGLNLGLDLDNINVQFLPPPGLIAFEDFDITPFLNQLVAGTNLLAVQGLNITAGDADFLAQPELRAADFLVSTQANYIAPATPGTWNNVTGGGRLAPVTFSPASGIYSSNTLAVQLASSASSATIYYTLDGTSPTLSSLLYTGAITISVNAAIRARALEAGKVDSEVTAANYIMVDSSLTNFTSNLPLVIVDSLGGTIVENVKIPAYAIFLDTNASGARVSLKGPFDYRGRVGIEIHGQSSTQFPKKSFNLETDDETGTDLKTKLLGLPKSSDWGLYAPYTDKTFMNDYLTYELHEAMGHYAVRRKFVEVFVRSTAGRLSTNDYLGVYVFLEKIRIDDNRVNIAKLKSGDNAEPDITGGYIWKKDKDSPGDVNFTTTSGQFLKYHDPKGADLSFAQRAWLLNHLNTFEAALYGPNWRDPVNGYLKYIEPDSFVDQHWIVEFPKNIDGYRLSDYMSKDRGGKIRMDPIWDWNLSWGNANYLEGGLTNNWYFPQLGSIDDIWLSRLRQDPDFYQRIIDRWGQLRTNTFALSNLLGRVNRITNELWEAQSRDFARWPRLSMYVWPNPDGGAWHVNYATPGTFPNLISEMKKWITGRSVWVDSQFLRAPLLSLPSGPITPGVSVSITGTVGSIYYTLDGSDPRASGGTPSLSARLYTGSATLTNNVGLIARTFYTNGWSPPVQGLYVVATPTLAITEIMYHPTDPPTNSPWRGDDFEYLEIKNTGTNSLNLQGARLAGGIDYTFLPTVLLPTGTPTTNNFDTGGTGYTAAQLNTGPAVAITAGGPSGNFLRLLDGSTTNTMRNRIAFNQTAPGSYSRVTANFDFRATTVGQTVSNGTATVQNFDGAATNYVLGGSAAVLPANAGSSGGFLRIVPDLGALAGTVGFDRTGTGAWNTVTTTFDFRITPSSEANQADGMGFAFINTGTFGTSGAAPGVSEEPNLANSLGLGIDDYNNAEINNNHLSLHWNNAIVGSPASPTFDFSNGKFHRAQVIVRFSGGSAFVTVRVTPDINGTPGATETLFQNMAIAGVAPYEGRAAFGARTGGQSAAHDIDNLNVQYSTDSSGAAGLSMLVLPASAFGASGAGTTLAQFTDAPTVTNTFALDLAFNPSNTANDVTFYWNRAAVFSGSPSLAALDLDNGLFHHAMLQIDKSAGGSYLTLVLTPDSLGTPGTPIVVASNLFIAGLTPDNARIEFAGRNGNLSTTLDVENVGVNYFQFAPLTLAPGQCILVVKNRAAFESRYGTGFNIAGEFSGTLDNAGDHLVLLGPVGEVILDFNYSDDWYRLTDGLGFSLVAADLNAPPGTSGAWHNSSYQGGSPGAVDPVLNLPPVVVNEILANSVLPDLDTIELHNPTTNLVDVGGWYLTDDFNTPKKFRLANGTTIPAGGFRVFTEADFNPAPGATNSFALSAYGDEVWLFSGNVAGDLTGYVQGYDFGPSAEGVSIGRYLDSTGNDHFVAQSANTFNATNAGPRLSEVVISEIMFRPPDVGGEDDQFNEFIELHNRSASPAPLYSLSLPTDTWHLSDAVDFVFPINITLAAGERLVVVGFDPNTNAVTLAAFRDHFGIAPTVQIFGPWSGKLDNSGDDVELRQPLPPGTNGTAYALVDKVDYKDATPWPAAADGYGASLHRLNSSAYGNDPINWSAATPTPGATFAGGTAPAITGQPAPAATLSGRTTNFTLSATGPALQYQWRAHGTNLPGATNTTLVLTNIQLTEAGFYHAAVFNPGGAQLTDVAYLTIYPPITFTVQPTNQNVLPGTNVTLVSLATGTGPVRYQWRLNGTNMPNATNASHSFIGASLAHHGLWQVTATDNLGSIDSLAASVFVLIKGGVAVPMQTNTVLQGGNATFSIVATGAPPMGFRWLRNGAGYFTSSVPTVTFTNVQSSYRIQVVVTNLAGSSTASPGAGIVNLIMLADFDHDGVADLWETQYGFNTNNAADALLDFDGDGMNNRDEYLSGTNPTNALSVLKIVLSATNAAVLNFTAQSNISYTVQWRTNLVAPAWSNLTSITALPLVRTVLVNSATAPAAPERYLRIVTPSVP